MRRSVLRSAATAVVALVLGLLAASPASADDPPQVPQQVAEYFATGLIPRLIDLYGAGNGVTEGTDFDATTTVGGISRVYEWTPDFLAGKSTNEPTRFTNNWVAPVSVRGKILGLATVWINPATDLPELASFDSPELAIRLSTAPAKSVLVSEPSRQAWFAVSGTTLTPLVPGTSRVTGTTTTDAYQLSFSPNIPAPQSGISGVALSALVLGVVVLGLAIFVLLPVRKRPAPDDDADDDDPDADDEADDDADDDDPDADDEADDGADDTHEDGDPSETPNKTGKTGKTTPATKADTPGKGGTADPAETAGKPAKDSIAVKPGTADTSDKAGKAGKASTPRTAGKASTPGKAGAAGKATIT